MTLAARLLRLAAAALMTGAVAACGFTPIYADRGEGLMANLADIDVQRIESETEAGYFLQSELQRRLGHGAVNRYNLSVQLEETLKPEAITRQANTLRYSYTLKATYQLMGPDGENLLRKRHQSLISYGVAPSQYATLIAREEAIRKASREIAESIELDLVFYFREQGSGLDGTQSLIPVR